MTLLYQTKVLYQTKEEGLKTSLEATTMAATYEHYLAKFLVMNLERCNGHYRELDGNLKHKRISQAFAQACRDAHATLLEREDKKLSDNYAKRKNRDDDPLGMCKMFRNDTTDPRITSGTHKVIVEMQKCGGKGQLIRVEKVVAVDQEE